MSNPSCYVCSRACQEVYNALDITDRFGFYIDGGHNHCAIPAAQVPPVRAFVDKFLLGIDTANTEVAVTPFNTDLTPWINWTTPTLSNGTSFFGRTTLIYPSNVQKDLDTTLTFTWSTVEEAQKYLFELSANATFTNIIESDSTTDTVKTVTGLMQGKQYYWRVQVKNMDGSTGPFSGPYKFITYIPLPAMPVLGYVLPLENREGWYNFTWNNAQYAERYRFQISRLETFTTLVTPTVTTSDTLTTVSGLLEGQKYYWEVQGQNIEGSGPWNVTNFITILFAPSDLALQISSSSEITLNWTDNSHREDGYVIERKQEPQTSFSVLDTLKGSGHQYLDNSVDQGQTYAYRIKAYRDSVVSEYSNEASITFTGIKEEQELPTEYSISQNYPNPFNPTTKIKFALPKKGFTKIIIYDLLGREVMTLVNKELQTGYHEINIAANNLPSGVYIYRIQSGNFTQAKKMILMK